MVDDKKEKTTYSDVVAYIAVNGSCWPFQISKMVDQKEKNSTYSDVMAHNGNYWPIMAILNLKNCRSEGRKI